MQESIRILQEILVARYPDKAADLINVDAVVDAVIDHMQVLESNYITGTEFSMRRES